MVRRDHDHQHGDRPDPPAGGPQHLHRQLDRARRAGHAHHVGDDSLRAVHVPRDRDPVRLSRDRDLASGPLDGPGDEALTRRR